MGHLDRAPIQGDAPAHMRRPKYKINNPSIDVRHKVSSEAFPLRFPDIDCQDCGELPALYYSYTVEKYLCEGCQIQLAYWLEKN